MITMNKQLTSVFKIFELNLAFHFSDSLDKLFVYPTNVYLSLTNRCTLNCKMCDIVKLPRTKKELTTKEIKKILDEVKTWNGDQIILLTGGEPFIRKDVFDIINYSVSLGLRTEVVSNGTLIDEKTAEKIMDSGLTMIAISLDSSKPKIHDDMRGVNGAFNGAVRAIKNLVKAKVKKGYGPLLEVWTTITNLNLEELYNITPFTKKLGVECLVYHPVIIGQAQMQEATNEGPLWIPKSRIPLMEKNIKKIEKFSKSHPNFVAWLHDTSLFSKYFRKELGKSEWKCNPYMFVCITMNGQLQICGESFGDIRKKSITELLNSDDAFKLREKMKKCDKNCLQSCWARPEADNLSNICNDFLKSVSSFPKSERKMMIKKGLGLLNKYEKIVEKSKV